MKLDINLMPKPQKKGYDIILILLCISFTIVFGSYFGVTIYLDEKEQMNSLDKEIEVMDQLKTEAIQRIKDNENQVTAKNYVAHYFSLHSFMNDIYIDPYVLLQEIGNQLPAIGKLDSLTFRLDGKVELEGVFGSKGDVATFLDHLLRSSYVLDAEVKNISQVSQAVSLTADTPSIDEQYWASFVLDIKTVGVSNDD
jgi:Tfp pilus assembly protein PilN